MSETIATTGVAEDKIKGENAGYYSVASGGKRKLAMSSQLPGMGSDPQDFGGVSNDDMQGNGEETASFLRTLKTVADLKGKNWEVKTEFQGLLKPTYVTAVGTLGRLVELNKMSIAYQNGDKSDNARAAFHELESLKQQFKTDDIPSIAMHIAVVQQKLKQDEFNKRLIKRYTDTAS